MKTVQPAAVHCPDMTAGEGVGCCPLQPEPTVDAVALPVTPVGTTVPTMAPLIEQLLQARPENGMVKVPLVPTFVVPETLGGVQLRGPGGPGSGTLAVRLYRQGPAVTTSTGVGAGDSDGPDGLLQPAAATKAETAIR